MRPIVYPYYHQPKEANFYGVRMPEIEDRAVSDIDVKAYLAGVEVTNDVLDTSHNYIDSNVTYFYVKDDVAEGNYHIEIVVTLTGTPEIILEEDLLLRVKEIEKHARP